MAAKKAAKAPKAPEPAVMAAGASAENAEEGKGMPPAEPTAEASAAEAEDEAEGFRNDKGQFTGNAPTDGERIDAIVKVLKANGLSVPRELE
jgi:hypothetical protein